MFNNDTSLDESTAALIHQLQIEDRQVQAREDEKLARQLQEADEVARRTQEAQNIRHAAATINAEPIPGNIFAGPPGPVVRAVPQALNEESSGPAGARPPPDAGEGAQRQCIVCQETFEIRA